MQLRVRIEKSFWGFLEVFAFYAVCVFSRKLNRVRKKMS
ncbi:hypothetical protein CSUI_008748 [Cystoisospora suis]|uniref:Uncharacterized protein n=1 Tax=Cystoisospora suis TaxID=483139 RepID=A0A2C6KM09_9APIC|nr:hypothetical protein CSUI_008748 [Cystoisospora suis]